VKNATAGIMALRGSTSPCDSKTKHNKNKIVYNTYYKYDTKPN